MSQTNPQQQAAVLRGVPIFRGLRRDTLFEVARRVEERSVPAGTVIARQGDEGGELYVILHGSADVERDGDIIATLGDGDFVGEMSLIDGRPRSASVVTSADCRVLILRRRDFMELINIPRVGLAVIEGLVARLRQSGPGGEL